MKGKNIAYEKGRARLQGFLSLITVLICTGLCPGQGNWTWNNPLTGSQLFSVDGKYVGLTSERWMTSMDGISWTIRPSRIQAYQNFSLYYGEGQFILGAKNGTGYEFSTSKDGLTWSVGTTITSKSGFSHIGGIVSGGGRYLATTSDNRLWVSENGRDWSQPDSTYPWSNLNLDIPPVFAADHFAILADTGFGSSTNTLWTSSDGRVWKRGGTLKRDPYLLLYGNNSFVALPQNMSDSCYVSKDGITWTAVQTGWRDRPRYGNFLDGEFLVYGPNGDIWGSTEGAYWYRNAQISSPIRQVVKGPGGFLAVREANPFDQDECPILSAPSINGPWNPVRKYNPTRRFNDVAYGDRKFVAVGDGIAISEDGGETWSSTTILGRDPPFQYVAFGAHAFVATGSVQSSNTLAYSADGKAWVHSQFKDLSAIDCVAFGAGRFVAVGKLDANHNAVITSTDGRVWSAPDTIKDCVYNNFVYFVNGKFLVWEACGDSFQTSPDGLTWTEVKPPSGLGGNLVYGNGKYVSSAGTGVRASIDLTNWKDSMLAPYSGTTQGVGFGFGKFIVVGDAGMIHFSDDGENWIRDSSTQFYSLNLQAVAIGEDRIVAVGTNGTVLVSLQGEAGLGPKVSRIAGQPPGFAPALRFHRGRMGVEHQGREFGMDGRRFLEIPSLISGGDEPSRRGGARNTR